MNIKESNKVDNSKTDGKITKPIKKGIVFKDAKTAAVYKITKINKRKDEILGGNVTLIKTTNKKRKVVRVADIVKYEDCGFKVTAVGDNAFKNSKKLQKLIIGKNVKKIGKNAFRGCKKLKRIVFSGDNIKKIGKNAFKGISKKARYSASVRIYEKLLKLIKKSGKKK